MEILQYIQANNPKTIGIDGNSGSGKTTLANELAKRINAFVLPLDLFHKYERKDWDMNTRMSDFEDLKKVREAINKIKKGERFTLFNMYNHNDGTHSRTFKVEPRDYLIVEGLCTMNLDLDFKIFLNVNPKIALVRGKERDIRERNLTEEQWVVKKNLFHDQYSKLIPGLKKKADLVIDTTNGFPELK